jgi:mono/diheme cytochrome c family protein
MFIPAPIGPIYAANLTKGQGGIGQKYTDADYVRAIRHGVNPSGRGLIVMPSDDYYNMSDDDLGALIAYLKIAPPVNNVTQPPQVGFLGRALFVAGALPAPSAERVNHTAARPTSPKPSATVEYGNYLASISCIGCHRKDMAGGPLPGAQPNDPLALNLTQGGDLAGWSEADFIKAMRVGVAPSGRQINDRMPWKNLGNMNDDELKALYVYLKSLPAKPQTTK